MQPPGNSPHVIDLNTWFSEQLDAQHPDLQYSEQLWDRRAAEVSSFTVSADDLALQTVQQRLQLAGSRVLEISFGGGRHLLEFARHGARVSGVEISANMIAHTRDKLRQLGPLSQDSELIQSAWENIDLAQLGWEQAFDLVFLYMSPAISSTAMLRKVLRASRGHVYLALYCDRSDSLLGELQDEFGLERRSVGSKGADDVYQLFNLLYQWGYFPELRFEERSKTSAHPPAYLLERYASWLWREQADDTRREQLHVALERRTDNELVSTRSRDIVGHLLLDTRLRSNLRR